MKYIVLRTEVGGLSRDIPVIFPDMMVHSIVADSFITACRLHWAKMKISILSAGEYSVMSKECFGKSESLHVESRGEEDTRLIKMYDYTHGLI